MEKKVVATAAQILSYKDPLETLIRSRMERIEQGTAQNYSAPANDEPELIIPDWVRSESGPSYTPPVIVAKENREIRRKARRF